MPTVTVPGDVQDEIIGGLFAVDITVMLPQFLEEDAPKESVAVIETLNVPVEKYVCDADDAPPEEDVPSPQFTETE